VAGKNRGGRSVGDDDAFDDDNVDRAETDELDDEFDDFDDEPAEEESETTSPTRTRSKVAASSARSRTAVRSRDEKPGFFRNIPIFIREVFAELQKVIWPTRKELLTYTTVVVIFVAIMMSIVSGLDVAFARLLLVVFGSAD
jgi:preprotein translocase subunit SecE